MGKCRMIGITDQLISYDENKAAVHLDDYLLSNDNDMRLADFREKLIKQLYKFLQSDELKNLFVKQNEQIDLNIKIKSDHVKINY